MMPTDKTLPIDKRLPTDNKLPIPIPKPRTGQGRAGIRRKARVILPTLMPMQTPAMPIPTPAPRAVQSLPETVVQLQERSQPVHHLPAPPPLSQLTGPTCITQPIGPKIEHRPIPPFPDLYQRLPPRCPDVTDLKDTRKDLLDLDTDRNINFNENSPYQEGIILEMYERPDKILYSRMIRIKRSNRYH